MICTILGCGSSSGVPEIGCACFTCSSSNPKNKRLRSSIHIASESTSILIDSSPDLRMQALDNNILHLDAVLYTHDHSDHTAGIDDLKSFSQNGNRLKAFGDVKTMSSIANRFPYIFKEISPLYPSRLESFILEHLVKFEVGDISILPFLQSHGKTHSIGFRMGELAYSTDFDKLPDRSISALQGVRYWIVDCLRYAWSPTHSYLEETFKWIEKVNPEIAILTHMAHDIEYEEIKNFLPKNIIPAFDGMKISFNS